MQEQEEAAARHAGHTSEPMRRPRLLLSAELGARDCIFTSGACTLKLLPNPPSQTRGARTRPR